jgi:uncharacterized protein Yka (UPF0111/DUF47 family)
MKIQISSSNVGKELIAIVEGTHEEMARLVDEVKESESHGDKFVREIKLVRPS